MSFFTLLNFFIEGRFAAEKGGQSNYLINVDLENAPIYTI